MAQRHHFAIVTKRTKGGLRVERAPEFMTRGEADKATLTLCAYHPIDRVSAVTVERELRTGDVLPAA